MLDAGILGEDAPVELLDGCLVSKMPKYPLHSIVRQGLGHWLAGVVRAGFFVNIQEPITTASSEPEADASVIRGERLQFAHHHPKPDDVALIGEVSDSSLRRDRGWKKRIYAQANIPQYWILNLVDRQVEVYLDPDPAAGDYRQPKVYAADEEVPLVIDGVKLGGLRLEQLLPKA